MGNPVRLLWGGAQDPLQLKAALIMKPWRSADPHSLLSPCLAHKLHQLYIHRSVLL